MKYRSSLILLCFILGGIRLIAQSIEADIKTGCDSLKVNFRLNPPENPATPVSWNFGNGRVSTGNHTPSSVYNVPGKFTVTCLINNTKLVIATDLITLYKTPSSNFRYNDTLAIDTFSFVFRHIKLPEDTATLIYNWQFSDISSNIVGTGNSPTIIFKFPKAGNYHARLITSNNGCSSATERNIMVADVLSIPNVFTPDNDTWNDYFQVRTNGKDTYIFSVYSRSGVLVYRSESPDISWDGRSFSGQKVTQGIYFYSIEQKGSNIKLKGFIYLWRKE